MGEYRETSREAFERTDHVVNRITIEEVLKDAYPDGHTCDAMEQSLGMLHQTASATIRGLDRNGLVTRGPDTRPTRTGCKADVIRWRR